MCVALLSSSRLIVSHWLTSREMRLCIWRRGLGRGSRSCTQRPPCLRLGSRQAPPSRFGHVFVGIDASSKLLIWGGLNCDACPSQTLGSLGSAQDFYMAQWSLPFSHCPEHHGGDVPASTRKRRVASTACRHVTRN